jgi:WD40 repeat protein
MFRYMTIILLGVAIFLGAAWYLGLRPGDTTLFPPNFAEGNVEEPVTPADKLGDLLLDKSIIHEFKPIELPRRKNIDPIVLPGQMTAFETEEVPSKVAQGSVLFIGDQVDEAAVLAAGSAAFLAEPYYPAEIYAGRNTFVKFFRRHYEGDTVRQGQMLGMVDPAKAFSIVLEKIAKIAASEADRKAAQAAEKEGETRKIRADYLYFEKKAIPAEDHGAAVLTWIKLMNERISADEKVKLAEIEKDEADVDLYQHQIRARMPYKTFTIKSIQRGAGAFVKQMDPVVMTVQNIERLMAEAPIDEQYAVRLKENMTATIEPTIIEAPIHELPGHTAEVNSVAVTKNNLIISGSEDHSICVWARDSSAPLHELRHDDAVKVVACSPVDANLVLAGCGDGSIWMWEITKDGAKQVREPIRKAHGNEAHITALAFSTDGKYFASGGSDGSIKLWTTDDGMLKYPFDPAHGVARAHDDAVTSLAFTPQCRLVSAGGDNTLRVWVLKDKGAYLEGKIEKRKGTVRQLGVSRDGQWMLFDQGHMLKLYSVQLRKFVHTINLPANATPFDTLAQFSPDGSLMLTAGAPEGRLQLWSTPTADKRGFEVRQLATRERQAVTCATFAPTAGKDAFMVSGAGHRLYVWAVPTAKEIAEHRIENVPLTLKTQSIDPTTKQTRIGFEVANQFSPRYPNGRFEAGRPVTIVID